MVYLLATVGAITVIVLLWRALKPESVHAGQRRSVPPDDNPEFLRSLDTKPHGDDPPDSR